VTVEHELDLEREREPEPAPAVAAPAPATPAVSRMLGLQQGIGNAAVTRMLLQRDGVPDGAEYDRERAARQAFIDGGVRGPEDFQSSAGRGGFQVAYVPDYNAMNVTLKGGVDFQDGIRLMMGVFAVAVQPSAQVAAAVRAINSAPVDQRAALVAPWQWTDGEKTTFLADFERAVTGVWHRDFEFHASKHYWEDLGAKVNVFVQVHAGEHTDDDHMQLKTYKIASGQAAGGVGVVNSFTGNAHGNTMTLNSTDVSPRSDIQLTRTATFNAGATTFSGNGAAVARGFGGDFIDQGGPRCGTCGQQIAGMAGTTIHVRVQGSGADPNQNAQDRFTALTTEMANGGMTNAATRCQFEYAGEGNDATMVVGTGDQQIVAAHEAGHMFGLGDEYTNPFGGTGQAPGSAVDGQLGPAQNLPGSVSENNDSIMSVGNAVKPQHYATFLEALKHVTGMQEWAFGPAEAVLPPGVDGPLPTPPGQTPQQPQTAVA
jgi:hypothetical protein